MTGIYPKLEALPFPGTHGETLWRVTEPIRFKIAPRWYIEVPEGYVSNLGTIPRWARFFVSPSDFPGPFVLHDYMCSEDHVDDGQEVNSGYSRWLADAALYEMLCRYQPAVPFHKRWTVWFAIRAYARWKGLK